MAAEYQMDPSSFDAVVGALTRSSLAALEASHELLAHYSDTGDGPTQRAVDALIDQSADALRALTDSLSDLADEVQAIQVQAIQAQAAMPRTTTLDPAASRYASADGGTFANPRPRRGR
jgi:hypothetical protein